MVLMRLHVPGALDSFSDRVNFDPSHWRRTPRYIMAWFQTKHCAACFNNTNMHGVNLAYTHYTHSSIAVFPVRQMLVYHIPLESLTVGS